MKKIPFLLGALGLAACAPDAPDVGGTSQEVFAADGDPLAVDDAGEHPQVVSINQPKDGWDNWCTGTIIASNKVITAAHCANLVDADEIEVRFNFHPQALQDALENEPGFTTNDDGVLVWTVASKSIHPLFDSIDPLDTDVDIAILTMATPVSPTLITPLPVLEDILPSPFIAGQAGYDRWVAYYADFFGAGLTDDACEWGFPSQITKLTIEILDAQLGPNFHVQLMWLDNTGWGSHTCGGDSGGPFVTTVADYIGENNIPPGEVMGLLSGGTTGQAFGPLLVGANRTFVAQQALDADGDGLEADVDNCDHVWNPGQSSTDSDGDGFPDVACDDDDDNDGLDDWQDNCDTIANADQANNDGDASGDPCDWDDDGDFVSDADDNCPMISNAGQANCNADAELLGFAGSDSSIELGDACDPVPCAPAKTVFRDFDQESLTWWATGEAVCVDQHGRLYEDYVDLVGRVAADSPALDTEKLEVWFCGCEADTLAECAAPPWNCALSPTAGPQLGSRWRKLTLTEWDNLSASVPQPLAATFDPWESWLPSDGFYRWDYLTDYNAWIVGEGLWTPTPNSDAVYGDGTDMMGVLWVEDPSKVGIGTHDASCIGSGCSMASSYLTQVAPDRAATLTKCHEIPELAPAPWWSYCARCEDMIRMPWEDVINPGYLAVVGTHVLLYTPVLAEAMNVDKGTSATVTSMIAEGLHAALRDRNTKLVAPSEVVDQNLRRGMARAMLISTDATRMRGELVAGEQQFELRAPSGAAATGIGARTGFATAYSLNDGGLRIVGGVDRNGRTMGEYWRWSPSSGWRRTAIDTRVAPTAAVSSLLGGDHALWVVDRAGGRFTLKRIVEKTGAGRVATLDELGRATDAWLFPLADGGVALATSYGDTHLLSRLAWTADGPRVVAQIRGEGALSGAPYVSGGGIAVPVDVQAGDFAGVTVQVVPAADLALPQ